jgi:hypothetical protein
MLAIAGGSGAGGNLCLRGSLAESLAFFGVGDVVDRRGGYIQEHSGRAAQMARKIRHDASEKNKKRNRRRLRPKAQKEGMGKANGSDTAVYRII